jgi:hypothetical protein
MFDQRTIQEVEGYSIVIQPAQVQDSFLKAVPRSDVFFMDLDNIFTKEKYILSQANTVFVCSSQGFIYSIIRAKHITNKMSTCCHIIDLCIWHAFTLNNKSNSLLAIQYLVT